MTMTLDQVAPSVKIAACADVFDYASKPLVIVPRCPVCDASIPTSHPTMDRYGYRIGVSACGGCGLYYLNPRLSAADYQGFYEKTYRRLAEARYPGGHATVTPLAMQAHGAIIGDWLWRSGYTGGALLDVGGGTGDVAAGLQGYRAGVTDITVLDPDDTALEQAQARGYHTLRGLVEAQPAMVSVYDAIVATQTIDHWLDPLAALRWIRAALRPQGRLYLDMIDARVWRAMYPLQAFKIDHPLYWTPKSLRVALTRTGWQVRSTYITWDRRRVSFLCQGV